MSVPARFLEKDKENNSGLTSVFYTVHWPLSILDHKDLIYTFSTAGLQASSVSPVEGLCERSSYADPHKPGPKWIS